MLVHVSRVGPIFCQTAFGPTGFDPWIPAFQRISKNGIFLKPSHWNLNRYRAETRIVIFVENSVVENEILTPAKIRNFENVRQKWVGIQKRIHVNNELFALPTTTVYHITSYIHNGNSKN